MHSLITLNDENFSFENILNFQTVYQIHEKMCYCLALTVGQNVLVLALTEGQTVKFYVKPA